MKSPRALRTAFGRLPPVEYRRTLYRVILPKFLRPTPLSGVGAKCRGSRFTPKGEVEVLYLAEDPLTAFVEYQHADLTRARTLDDEFAVRLAVLAVIAPHVVLHPSRVLD